MLAATKLDDLARRAAQLHAAGSTDEAIALCQRILRGTPRSWQALMLLGLIRRERNELHEAEALLAHAAQINPAHADVAFHLACVHADLGQLEQARAGFEKLLARQTDSWLLHFRLGLVEEARHDRHRALAHYRRATQLNGRAPEAWINLGNVQLALGEREAAVGSLERALQVDPTSALAHLNLGLALAGDPSQAARARAALDKACRLDPGNAQTHFLHGIQLDRWGSVRAAREAYERALAIRPDYAEALNNIAVLHLNAGEDVQAGAYLERCVAVAPGFPEGWNNLGNLRMRQERWSEAREAFEAALRAAPQFAPALTGLGSVHNEAGALTQARACYETALRDQPDRPQTLAALANVMQRQGDIEAAAHLYDRAIALSDSGALRIKRALMLSAVMTDEAQIDGQREGLRRSISALRRTGVEAIEDALLQYPDTCFFLAYHGRDDLALLREVSELMIAACPRLAHCAPHTTMPRPPGERIRIGFVSRYFHRHSVGLFFNPIIADLAARSQFEVLLFSIGEQRDQSLADLAARASKHVHVPATSLPRARRLIERERLDLLVYPEIGMDPFTWLLSFSRLARRQCVLQGHSNTTGVPNVDCYVSSALIEPADAQMRYSERLELLPTLPMYLEAPPEPSAIDVRARFDLPGSARLYLCPMKLQKVHPQMDEAFAAILRRDAQAVLLLVGDHTNEAWDLALRARLKRHLGDCFARVRFVPWQANLQDFLALIAASDVVLDSFHHGGATTSHLALSCGKPVVTLPADHARGRFLLAYYGLLQVDECIAADPAQYVDIALELGRDATRREALSARIRARIASLHDHRAVFDAYADLFWRLGAEAATPLAPGIPYAPLRSVREWCSQSGADYQVLEAERSGSVPSPAIAGRLRSPVISSVRLPECYLAQLTDVEVIGGENFVLADARRRVLHDSALRYDDARVDIAAGAVLQRCGDHVLLGARPSERQLERGIHLLGRGTTNYYHWLLEYLPRLQGLEGQPQYADWPLLVDARLHPNLLAALERVCPGRPIVTIESGAAYRVDRLVVLGPRVWMPIDYRHGATVLADDILFAPEALRFLRERLAAPPPSAMGTDGAAARRRLYLRRGPASYRRLVNEEAIEAIFVEQGFEVVCAETLSLDEQIALFSQAEAIAGPTGAAMTNMVFAPTGCHVMVLYYPDVPFFYFSTLAAALGHELVYLLGEPIPESNPILYQLDFRMDPAHTGTEVRALVDRLDAARARGASAIGQSAREAIGFLAHMPELFNHYRAIWAHLRNVPVEIVNAGEGADRDEIDRLAAQAGLVARPVEACLGQPRLRCLVSNHPVDPSGDPLIKRLAHLNVRLMYGLGKANWNLREWNSLYDAILCFGPHHAEALARVTGAALVQVGYPRFDPFFQGDVNREALLETYGADPAKPTVVWLPTWKELSSVPLHAASVAGLQRRFNVIVKLHPLAHGDGSDSARILAEYGVRSVILDSSDNLPLYRIADYMLCDYGGPAFGALYTDRRLVLLNVPEAQSDAFTGPDSPDILIRQVVVNVDPGSTEALEQVLADTPTWAQQRIVRHELRRAFFAPYYGFSARVAAGALEHIASVIALERNPW